MRKSGEETALRVDAVPGSGAEGLFGAKIAPAVLALIIMEFVGADFFPGLAIGGILRSLQRYVAEAARAIRPEGFGVDDAGHGEKASLHILQLPVQIKKTAALGKAGKSRAEGPGDGFPHRKILAKSRRVELGIAAGKEQTLFLFWCLPLPTLLPRK